MDRIWAPWRVKYVTKIIDKQQGCIFCQIAKEKNDKKNLIFIRTKYCYAVLNLYPYNNGHSLILPFRHVDDLNKLRKGEQDDLFSLLNHTKELLGEVLSPAGYNIGINIGREAGAGFPGHLHFHIVPRWKGDVNFMPVLGKTKVISQSLQALHQKLSSVHRKKAASRKK